MIEVDINDLCKDLENLYHNKIKVTYFNGIKPAAPQLITTKMILSGVADTVQYAWFAEVYVDGRCIHRQSYVPDVTDNGWVQAEYAANQSLISAIFSHGVMAAKYQMEEFDKQKLKT